MPLLAGLGLAACSTAPGGPRPDTGTRVTQAATAPLADLNLVRAQIPAVLQAARRAPYAEPPLPPGAVRCVALGEAVEALDAVLGPDLDRPPSADDPGLIERGSEAAGDAAVGALRRTAEGVLPLRGWVRKLTGAERHAREVAAAIAAGTLRRAYLKGLGQALGCAPPAAPARPAEPAPPQAPAAPD